MPHEISKAFEQAEFPLKRQLVQMLDNHFSHCTDRRGCGYTQATRFLSPFINNPDNLTNTNDLNIFSRWPISATENIAIQAKELGWPKGWRQLHAAPKSIQDSLSQSKTLKKLVSLIPTIHQIKQRVSLPESKVFVGLIEDLLTREGKDAPAATGMSAKPDIGSCSQAEEFFLEIAHGRIRRGGSVNVIVDEQNFPTMVEKINLGESHSAFVVSPVNIFGVWIPAGSLCALKYQSSDCLGPSTAHGHAIPLAKISEVRFLRLTTLSAAPADRQRSFTTQVEAQIRAQMLSPLTTTTSQLLDFANNELKGFAA